MSRPKHFSQQKRKEIYDMFDGRCAYCGDKINFNNFYIDHIEPVFIGGSNKIENLFPSCFECNSCKTYLSIEQFRQKLSDFYGKDNFQYRILEKYYHIRPKTPDFKFYFEKYYEGEI